jgi:endogenous inhibitor of DNA gyrase (YacG/DUF329 family)
MSYNTPQCPACGDELKDDGNVPDSIKDGTLHVAITCPTCETPIRVDFDDFDPITGSIAISVQVREE